MFMANAAIGALLLHCILFWGPGIVSTFKSAKAGKFEDRHHAHMAKNYKEAPWWWYIGILVISFVLGLIVVLKEDVTLPAWAYVLALVFGIIIAPFVSVPHCSSAREEACLFIDYFVLTSCIPEHHSLREIWKWYRHQQPFEDAGRSPDSREAYR